MIKLKNNQTIKEIKAQLLQETDQASAFIKEVEKDTRSGVQNAIKQWRKKLDKQANLKAHFMEMQQFELQARNQGYKFIAGIDEVGRGPLAGPVVAAAVILPECFNLVEVNDSKQLSASKREELFTKIKAQALAIGIGVVDEKVIDKINIYEATKYAMMQAIEKLEHTPDCLLIDAMTLPCALPQEKIIKGDAKSISIACASIIAKVTRDRMMVDYDHVYPGYCFAKNAGYGTKEHLAGIEKKGICPIHRQSFAPIKNLI